MSLCDPSHQQMRRSPRVLLGLDLGRLLRLEAFHSADATQARCRRIVLAARSFLAAVSFSMQRQPSLPPPLAQEIYLECARGNVSLSLQLTWQRQASNFRAATARV